MTMRANPIALVLAMCGAALAADNWPQFRGEMGQNRSAARGLPLVFGENRNVVWKTPIHDRGWSSPVIWGNQIWLTTATRDGRQLYALCVDRDTGRIIFDLKLFDVANPQFCHPFNSYASPTPAIEEGRVYITFGSPGTACLDTATGKVLWQRTDFVCNHFRGAGSSPVLFENLLLMHFDGSDLQYVVALDKQTGRTVWKTNRSIDFRDTGPDGRPQADGDFRKAFSTPVVATVGGRLMMISLGSKACYGYDVRSGEELWRIENRACHSGSPTPVVGEDAIYVCMGLAQGQLWAIRPGRGLLGDQHVLWRITRNVPTRSSPVLASDLLFMVDDGGIATCVEAKTGAEVWRQRLKGNYSASPLYADGRIYFCNEHGHVTVVEAAREFRVLAENKFDDGFMASPAVAGKALYLRSRTHLYRIEEPP